MELFPVFIRLARHFPDLGPGWLSVEVHNKKSCDISYSDYKFDLVKTLRGLGPFQTKNVAGMNNPWAPTLKKGKIMPLAMKVVSRDGDDSFSFTPETLVIAGWAGRDREAMEHHIQELEAIGVARPAQTPTYYRVSAARLTTDARMEASGEASSGEVEPMIVVKDGKLYAGIGSDHTDREVETYGVTVSKQMCDKPVSDTLWPFEEVADHWDSLILRSYIWENGDKVLYQEGAVSSLLDPRDTIAGYGDGTLPEGAVLFCGTMPAIGGIRTSPRFYAEIEDPVLNRRISFGYDIVPMPIAG